ncbi:hypothetical protein ANCCAN_02614 [Ancylostoma caninum]|uniref:Uncharacterized protein n=1 Tax=Ancylostoma caninum TaxID=29170 RepID=A0A368H3R9_ANCCA|nr:hypothetical protein ANCCAN_02614 [Ancylostoma caninum]
MYVAVGDKADPSHKDYEAKNVETSKKMAGKEEDYIAVGSFDKLNKTMDQVVKRLCNKEIK